MTEYWQSQSKKFCDFCKCWLTDNKPSIAFHENGKKHKENVERRIKEVRKRGIQVRKDDNELKTNLQAIEAAAMEAYKKDIGEDTCNISGPTKSSAEIINTTDYPQTSSSSKPSQSSQTTTGCRITYSDGQPVASCVHSWSVLQTSEGYYYYYNTHTEATQWEVPDCLQTGDSEDGEPTVQETTTAIVQKKESVGDIESTTNQVQPAVEEKKTEVEKPSKNSSPYGSWMTVRTIEAPSITSETLARIQETPATKQATNEDPEHTAKITEAKFKERATPKLPSQNTDEVVPFKKRKLNSEKKRNIRQTKF